MALEGPLGASLGTYSQFKEQITGCPQNNVDAPLIPVSKVVILPRFGFPPVEMPSRCGLASSRITEIPMLPELQLQTNFP